MIWPLYKWSVGVSADQVHVIQTANIKLRVIKKVKFRKIVGLTFFVQLTVQLDDRTSQELHGVPCTEEEEKMHYVHTASRGL